MPDKPILIATRGSALALTQANMVAAQSHAAGSQHVFNHGLTQVKTGD